MNEVTSKKNQQSTGSNHKKKRTEKFAPHEEEDIKHLDQVVKKVKFEQERKRDLEALNKLADESPGTNPDLIKISTNGKMKAKSYAENVKESLLKHTSAKIVAQDKAITKAIAVLEVLKRDPEVKFTHNIQIFSSPSVKIQADEEKHSNMLITLKIA
mmetsp:Transcript_8438/g.9536  ORF Transcript_8438/g.9536 Transcript_8438/m.9536 type:complete len:157 (+) Transcript_8438:65-535(+)|eukprot:CAMPEP_0176447104 /NCGR_PEP_ID=MMETSP0127-20121128/24795_1 /TAXON_ID=938130 /ORGANISM="Platyophrya macrostoma, Strain WH" /LENGTH=156 /DNA_ID=CAMNT_0017833411 /DNA_START=60 /DNA_END=530 /DNA_ORIENTATION=-